MKGGYSLSHAASIANGLTRHHYCCPRRRFSANFVVSGAFALTPRSYSWLHDGRYRELKEALFQSDGPSRVWTHYTSLLAFLDYEKLPIELHQEVLRKCTISLSEVRASAARRFSRISMSTPSEPTHIHEGRFQAIIRNIRASGQKPALEDYHFIMQHFAATGYHTGTMLVYKELVQIGLAPLIKTFGLCLQAIAHQLTLPRAEEERAGQIEQVRSMVAELLQDMKKHNIPLTSVSLDLLIRILKETNDRERFESLLLWGYGIDLANPDSTPLEYSSKGMYWGREKMTGLSRPFPFSTAALNTTVECLGRFGDISKMIQAFEVLTQPLSQAAQYRFSSFDDDEDFGVSVQASPSRFIPPSAQPNITTYNLLLRHLGRAHHSVLLRHYLLEVMLRERQAGAKIKNALSHRTPLSKISSPSISLNRGTLMPVLGSSNRGKNLGLMRWLSTKMPKILKRKRHDLVFYIKMQEEYRKRAERHMVAINEVAESTTINQLASPSVNLSDSPETQPVLGTSISGTLGLLPSASSFVADLPSFGNTVGWDTSKPTRQIALDVDINDNTPLQFSVPRKNLNFDVHITILKRDIVELEEFTERLEVTLGKTTQRIKERLGRRVWAGKDIFLRTNEGIGRLRISRVYWKNIVGYRPRPKYQP